MASLSLVAAALLAGEEGMAWVGVMDGSTDAKVEGASSGAKPAAASAAGSFSHSKVVCQEGDTLCLLSFSVCSLTYDSGQDISHDAYYLIWFLELIIYSSLM
jgi:hypothetical protein